MPSQKARTEGSSASDNAEEMDSEFVDVDLYEIFQNQEVLQVVEVIARRAARQGGIEALNQFIEEASQLNGDIVNEPDRNTRSQDPLPENSGKEGPQKPSGKAKSFFKKHWKGFAIAGAAVASGALFLSLRPKSESDGKPAVTSEEPTLKLVEDYDRNIVNL